MKSSSGIHFIALDHIRAFAAYLVILWHFAHVKDGYPTPPNHDTWFFPLSILSEGHTGVALFMTLSGYLFAKLLDGKSIDFPAFLWNRALRLFPLLFLVIIAAGIIKWSDGTSLLAYTKSVVKGALLPTLPNGGWSITVELHYYLLLPVLLWLFKQSRWFPILLIGAFVAFRAGLWLQRGEIQSVTYWSILGRIDQFALGMLAFYHREKIAFKPARVFILTTGFMMFYWWFDLRGGFYEQPMYPSASPIWVILPTLEGLAYAAVIAWYDNSFSPAKTGISKFISRAGELSYSVYLLHFFAVFGAAKFVNEHIVPLTSTYLIWFWATIFYVLMLVPAELSYRYIESPFLKFRKRYAFPSTDQFKPGGTKPPQMVNDERLERVV